MLTYTSHLFQLLDISCFFLLKQVYSQKTQKFARYNIHYINKKNFLLIYIKIKIFVFIEQTIKNRFLVTRFVPADFRHRLLLLTIINHKILSFLTTLQEIIWILKTPHTILQLKK